MPPPSTSDHDAIVGQPLRNPNSIRSRTSTDLAQPSRFMRKTRTSTLRTSCYDVPMSETVYSLSEVAELCGISYRHARRLVAAGRIHAVEVPYRASGPAVTRFVVTEAELRRFIRRPERRNRR